MIFVVCGIISLVAGWVIGGLIIRYIERDKL